MRAHELIQERSDARTEIENMATILPGSPDEYFVRFTDQDKIGFSARQHFGRTPDVDDPGFDPMALPRPQGRPALWFYPLRTYLKNKDLFASQHPYTWLVRLKPTAWLQRVGREKKTDVPLGKTRVGMLRTDQGVPMAIFFRPAFDVVDRWEARRPATNSVQEVQILSRVKGKGSEPSQLPKRGRPIQPGEEGRYLGRKIADWQGYEIYREFFGGQLTYTLFDPDTRRSVVTAFGSRYQQNPDSFVIAGLYAAPDNTVRAAEFYRILVQDLGITLISDNKQSPGGQRVWQQLERFPGIEIYGFDTRTGEVMNFGARDTEMYAVSADATKSKDSRYIANNIRMVATAR